MRIEAEVVIHSPSKIAQAKSKAPMSKSGTTMSNGNTASSPTVAVLVGEDVAAAKCGVIIEEWDPALAALLSGEGL